MDWQVLGAILSATVIVGGFFVWFWRKALPALRKWSRFADRIMGVPADPHSGQREIPGIFERLDAQDEKLDIIKHEVETNTGTSLKDAVRRVESGQRRVEKKIDRYHPDGSE